MHLFNLIFVASLVLIAALAAHQTPEISKVGSSASARLEISSGQQVIQTDGGRCPLTAEEIRSLHTVFVRDINIWMLETKSGPIGFDGGLPALEQCRLRN